MIIDVSECKVLLGITVNTYNEQIRQLIPYVQSDIIDYCNQTFGDKAIYRKSVGSLAFVRGDTSTATTDPDTITDADSDFTTAGFRANTDIVVEGGSNAGWYEVITVAAGALTLRSTGEVEDQSQVTYHNHPGQWRISQIKWPHALKPIAAKMVWYLIDKPKPTDVKSESIDDYSVTFAGSHEYPDRVITGLNRYRIARVV